MTNPITTIMRFGNKVAPVTSTLASGAANDVGGSLAAGGISAANGEAVGTLNSSLSQGIADQASIAAAQVNASTQQLAIGAAQQEANSTLHMAEDGVATAVKFQNKMADDAKDAI